jgi:hypothetical protein
MGCCITQKKSDAKQAIQSNLSENPYEPYDRSVDLFVVKEELSCNEQSYAPSKRGSYAANKPQSLFQDSLKSAGQGEDNLGY